MPKLYVLIVSWLLAFQHAAKSSADTVKHPDGIDDISSGDLNPPDPIAFDQLNTPAPFSIPKNVTCSGCVLQAGSRATLTYPLKVEEVTATIQVVPYVTIFPNTTVTSYSTISPNSTIGSNATISGQSKSNMSTSLTWLWNGVPLTYPTTYLAYEPSAITGGVPTTSTADFVGPTCDVFLKRLSLPSPPPYSAYVVPQGASKNVTLARYPLPQQLIDYLKTLPEISEVYSGRDIRTCTQTAFNDGFEAPPNEFHTSMEEDAVPKTSVLLLTTSYASPIVRTATTQPVLNIKGPNATPVAAHIENPAIPSGPGSGSPPTSPGGDTPAKNPGAVDSPTASGVRNDGSAKSPENGGIFNFVAAAIASQVGAKLPTSTPVAVSGVGGSGNSNGNAAQPPAPAITPPPSFPPTLTFSGQTITANSNGAFVIAGSTLTPGGPAATISGSTISLGRTGSGSTVAVINGIATTLSGSNPAAGLLTLDGTVFAPTVSSGSVFYVVDGKTLGAGQVITVHGTTLSLGSNGGALVINGQTSFIAKPSSVEMFTGEAGRAVISKAILTGFGLLTVGLGMSLF